MQSDDESMRATPVSNPHRVIEGKAVEKGVRTSEFWVTVTTVVGSAIIGAAAVVDDGVRAAMQQTPVAFLGPIVGSAIASGFYALGRSIRKMGKRS